jgi:hypothetical protein
MGLPEAPAVDVGALLAARNVVMVGASDRVAWSRGLHRNLRASPGLRRLWLVSPSSGKAHGEATVPSIEAIDDDIDLACVVVGAGRVVDALGPVAERGIPAASHAEVLAMLRALRGHALLAGGRGRKPTNLDRVAEVIADIAAAATNLGPRLHSIEINPLLADGDQVSVLDALILVRDA